MGVILSLQCLRGFQLVEFIMEQASAVVLGCLCVAMRVCMLQGDAAIKCRMVHQGCDTVLHGDQALPS